MPTKNGDITITAGSTDPIQFQVWDLDGNGQLVKASLLGVSELEWRLKNQSTDAITSFKKSTHPSQLSYTDDGVITFVPLSTDFTGIAIYTHLVVGDGSLYIPSDRRYTLTVLDNLAP
jgi:hypothetical protein